MLAPQEEVEAFATAFARETELYYPDIALNPDYTTIVSDRHANRLRDLLDDARTKGATIKEPRRSSIRQAPFPHHSPKASSTKVSDDMRLMQEEIFGPILPVVPYDSLEEAIAYVNARPRPLALYYFGFDRTAQAQVLARTTSGNVTLNETLLHYAQDDIPFGGDRARAAWAPIMGSRASGP